MKKADYIKYLQLQPHPEGGWYRQIYHSDDHFVPSTVNQERYYYTSIYFLLDTKSPSHFHRLKHDELWYYHAGDPITIYCLLPDGSASQTILGPHLEKGEQLQFRVSAGTILGSAVNEAGFSLVSCAVAPGFDYHDFEIFDQQTLLAQYPDQRRVIERLAYQQIPADSAN
ncbi:cupin domain-containing protein [uncultured Limosilactobacillus sp.]|uniref:cupin domain-containing protein n=1 Tax=uncultured Limosilactobacillus sp. TaxID=2837629 RepID=UPI0025D4C3E5|nr:cupin domain-containing protein [uncultured Limosilactobacillus sp.]